MERESARPGRKAIPANRAQRVSLGLKVTSGVKNALDTAARENGRTQSQEAEARLELSFRQEGLLAPALTLAYGPEIAAVLLIVAREFVWNGRIGAVISRDGRPDARQGWQDDSYAYDQAVRAAVAVMERFRPPGDPTLPARAGETAEPIHRRAQASAARTLAAIVDPSWGDQFRPEDRNRDLERFATEIRELLGPKLVARIAETANTIADIEKGERRP